MKRPDYMPVRTTLKKPTEKERKLALAVASAYKKRLKVERPFSRPWNMDLPVEMQSVFKAFLGTAKIVKELGASPKDYIEAQFRGLAWTGRFPFPNQLATPNARLRFEERRAKLETKEDKRVKADDYQVEEFTADRARLKRLKAATGFRTKEVLRLFRTKFSAEFIKYKENKRWKT